LETPYNLETSGYRQIGRSGLYQQGPDHHFEPTVIWPAILRPAGCRLLGRAL